MDSIQSLKEVEAVGDAALLRFLVPNLSTQEWEAVLVRYGGVRGLIVTDDARLGEVLPREAITAMRAACELTRRAGHGADERVQLTSPKEIHEYLRPQLSHIPTRRLVLLALDAVGMLMQQSIVSDSADIEIKNILRTSLLAGADAIILGQNHPTGSAEPTKTEIELAKRVKVAAAQVEVSLLDFVIVAAQGEFVSLRAQLKL